LSTDSSSHSAGGSGKAVHARGDIFQESIFGLDTVLPEIERVDRLERYRSGSPRRSRERGQI